jgi:hypothetical protein
VLPCRVLPDLKNNRPQPPDVAPSPPLPDAVHPHQSPVDESPCRQTSTRPSSPTAAMSFPHHATFESSAASSSSQDLDAELPPPRPRFSLPSAAGQRYARECSPVAFYQGRTAPTSSLSRSPPRAAHSHRLSLGHCLAAVHPVMCRSAHPSSSRHTHRRSPPPRVMLPRHLELLALPSPSLPVIELPRLSPRQVVPPPTHLGSSPLCHLPLLVHAGSPSTAPNLSSSGQAAACRELCSPSRTMHATLLTVDPFVQVAFVGQHSSSAPFLAVVVEAMDFATYHVFEGMSRQ